MVVVTSTSPALNIRLAQNRCSINIFLKEGGIERGKEKEKRKKRKGERRWKAGRKGNK